MNLYGMYLFLYTSYIHQSKIIVYLLKEHFVAFVLLLLHKIFSHNLVLIL